MNSLPVGGMITRIACGSTVRRIVIHHDMPSAVDASVWPSGTERDPGADDLGHVRGLVEAQTEDRQDEGIDRFCMLR